MANATQQRKSRKESNDVHLMIHSTKQNVRSAITFADLAAFDVHINALGAPIGTVAHTLRFLLPALTTRSLSALASERGHCWGSGCGDGGRHCWFRIHTNIIISFGSIIINRSVIIVRVIDNASIFTSYTC